jgi:deoxyribodipyrimidine photo-lyase
VRQACTGIAAIDLALQTLVSTGYLHNHARMWLASHLVHLRKVHWHVGAQWMYGHLLDGDLASNHLSWQWIAGTGSHEPYLFNAENVAKFAPPPWHSPGTVIDTSYEALESLARAGAPLPSPPASALLGACRGAGEPLRYAVPPEGSGWTPPQSATLSGQDVWLIHPWSLSGPPPWIAPGTVVIGIGLIEFHTPYPWNARRWNFVSRAMAHHTPTLWWGAASTLAGALQDAGSVQ